MLWFCCWLFFRFFCLLLECFCAGRTISITSTSSSSSSESDSQPSRRASGGGQSSSSLSPSNRSIVLLFAVAAVGRISVSVSSEETPPAVDPLRIVRMLIAALVVVVTPVAHRPSSAVVWSVCACARTGAYVCTCLVMVP